MASFGVKRTFTGVPALGVAATAGVLTIAVVFTAAVTVVGVATTSGRFVTQTTVTLEAGNNPAQGAAATPRKVTLTGGVLL